ncbi:hypothetical protein N9291_01010 [bacterium]|nr:hypothetical protein [bacterium]
MNPITGTQKTGNIIKMNHLKIASTILLATLTQAKASVVFANLNFGTDSITLHNNGGSIVDLGSTWLNLSVFNYTMTTCEANYGLWRYAIENPGYYAEWEEVVIVDPPVIGTGTGAIHIFADLGFRYVIHTSSDLKNWTEFQTVRAKSGQREKIPVSYQATDRSCFFQVEVIYHQNEVNR